MWVLILTLVSGYTGSPSSMTSVPGFKSLEACQAASDMWLRQQKNGYAEPKALCARQG